MKKPILTIILAGIISCCYGQGYVTVSGTMQNYTNTTALSASWTGGTNLTGTFGAIGNTASGQSYNVAVLTSTNASPITTLFGGGSAVTNNWLDTGLLGHNTSFTGRLSAGNDVLANNAPVGNTQSWLLVAWSSGLGANWATVSASLLAGSFSTSGFIGWSTVGVGAAGPPPTGTPLIIQGTSGSIIPNGITMFAVSPAAVPEPSTIALAALGGASLLLFRRRDRKSVV